MKRLIAGLMKFTVLSVLLIGSCAVPTAAYIQSPKWLLADAGPKVSDKSFYVASWSEGKQGSGIEVVRFDGAQATKPNVRYQLPDGQYTYYWPGGADAKV